MDKLRFLIETYVNYQKDRIRLQNRLLSLPEELRKEAFFEALAKDAEGLEKVVEREIASELQNERLRTEYLHHQRGIGVMISGYLIGWLARPRESKIFGIFGIKKKVGHMKYVRTWRRKTETLELPPYAQVLEEKIDGRAPHITVRLPPVMEVAENPSKLYKYVGLAPGSRLHRGERVDYNPRLKTLMWKILRQLLMAKGE